LTKKGKKAKNSEQNEAKTAVGERKRAKTNRKKRDFFAALPALFSQNRDKKSSRRQGAECRT